MGGITGRLEEPQTGFLQPHALSAFAKLQLLNQRGLSFVSQYADGLPPSFYPPASFSGCDIRAGIMVPGGKGGIPSSFKIFGDLQTITISSHRGASPVRCLGEHWVREYARGTRTIGGTLIFSVLNSDTLHSLMRLNYKEVYTPYTAVIDQIPPFNVTIMGVNESGQAAALGILDMVLINNGITLSIDDIFTEQSYTYVAKWATPFIDVRNQDIIRVMTQHGTDAVQRASLYKGRRDL